MGGILGHSNAALSFMRIDAMTIVRWILGVTIFLVLLVISLKNSDSAKLWFFGWGPWEGGMVTAALRKQFESEGVGLIPWSPLARGFLAGNRNREDRGETSRARTDEFAHKLY